MKDLFKNRNFAILLSGQWVSGVGNNLFSLAVYWYVLAQTHQPANLGLVGVALSVPRVLGLFSGVFVDRADRRRLMIGSDAVRAAISLGLGVLALVGALPIWLLLVLVLLLGLTGTLFLPASMALIPEIVEAGDLGRANAASGSVSSSASLVGQMGGGALMALLGPVLLFVANAVSFGVSVVSLLLMHTGAAPRETPAPRRARALYAEWREGLAMIWSHPTTRALICLAVLANLILQGVNVLAAAWVKGPLGGGAFAFGLFGASVTVGAIAGSLASARILERIPLHRAVPVAFVVVGIGIATLSRFPALAVSYAAVFTVGAMIGIVDTGVITFLQRVVPQTSLGRVFGTLTALTGLAMPVGAAVFGALASVWPLALIFLVTGIMLALAAVPLFGLRAEVGLMTPAT